MCAKTIRLSWSDAPGYLRIMPRSLVSLISLLSLLPLAIVGCTDADPPPDPDAMPSALARCADPAVPLAQRWQVDNLHDPITSIARTGRTVVVATADGALKTWQIAAAGATETRPLYGEPIVDQGVALGALAAGPGAAVVGIDVAGQARVWSADGAELAPSRALVPTAGTLVATDDQLRWLVGGTDAFAGELMIADLATGAIRGPLPTQLWHATAAHLGRGDRWITVGEWYGCPAIDVRDPRTPDVEVGYWDACRGAGATMQTGWFRALAVDAGATSVIAVGDQLLATFALGSIASGPTAIATSDTRFDRVARLDGDGLAITLAQRGDASELTWWSLDDLTVRRTATIPTAVDVAVDAEAGLVIAASRDGLLRGYACAP